MRGVLRSGPLRLLLTVGLLGLALLQVDFAELARGLLGMRPGLFAFALLALVVARWCAAARMQAIVRRQSNDLALAEVFAMNLKTASAGFFLPGNLAGGVVRWQLLTNRGFGRADALTAILLDRVSDFNALALTACAAAALSTQSGTPGIAAPLLAAVFVLGLLVQSALTHPAVAERTRSLLARAGLLRWDWARRATERVIASASAFHAMPWRPRAAIWVWSVASNCAGIVFYWALARAVGLGLGALEVGWIRGAAAALGMLPITLAGLGVREVAMIPLLAPYGVAPAGAVTFSLGLFVCGLIVAAVGGMLFAQSFLRRSGTARSVAG
jgi:uncharacterized protein (TIRG00374 family)